MLPTWSAVVAFGLVVALLTITPGIDTVLVLRTASTGARRRAWGTVLGIQTGTLAWGSLAAVGVSALLAASTVAYDVLRLAGATYLVWIGGRMLRRAIRGTGREVAAGRPDPSPRFVVGWLQGVSTNLLNPKVGAFYVALLPQFIPAAAPHLAWGVALAGVHVVLATAWLSTLLLLANGLGAWLRGPRVTRTVDGVAGTALIGFGVRLALEPRA